PNPGKPVPHYCGGICILSHGQIPARPLGEIRMTADAAELAAARSPAGPIRLPPLAQGAVDGNDLAAIWNSLSARVSAAPGDAAALIDLATIAHIQGRPADGAALQARALERQRIYRQPAKADASDPVRLLAFMAPGDFKANMPIEFIVQGSGVRLDMVYVVPGLALPQPVPEHDVALVAGAESEANHAILGQVAALARAWHRPVVNAPDRIARLTRDGTWALLSSAPGVAIPASARAARPVLAQIARGDVAIATILGGHSFPVIARPL